MATFDLSNLDWHWLGWRPWTWKLFTSMETGRRLHNDIGPVPAVVPGTLQEALRQSDLLPNWHVGMNSLACEWVEHRHWELAADVPGDLTADAGKIVLHAGGLDYSGWVFVDGQQAAEFAGVLKPTEIDLTDQLSDGEGHRLRIIFDTPPPEQGQIGFTSKSRYFKPRYNYSWDWCPRLVPIGTVGCLELRTDLDASFRLVRAWTDLADDLSTGTVDVTLALDGPAPEGWAVELAVLDDEAPLGTLVIPLQQGERQVRIEDLEVEPWWPNLHGPQKTYTLRSQVRDDSGAVRWEDRRTIGFRRIRWIANENAPEDAMPWICEVNGRPVFLQGVNWSPIRMAWADTTPQEYRRRVDLYREMGCTILRVWGGAYLETETFYDLCDAAGILVWQEFPLSSSGIDNWPPEDEQAIQDIVSIAETYIDRRAHHPSLFMWCGGNELQGTPDGGKVGTGLPAPPDHPCLAALGEVVARLDPTRRFLHTSASGPTFFANPENFGKGIHHEVHGPWGFDGDMEGFKDYWNRDDALFRAEVGVPGASDEALIRRYYPDGAWWPPTNDTWAHSSLWWLMWETYGYLGDLRPHQALAEYVRQTQEMQGEAYAWAAARCKERFPRCGGFIIWHGHDCFPCAVNNSIIDFEGNPKPAYYRIREVFRSGTGGD